MQGDPSSPVYFILHIPKTAGQTIQQHLADHCAPGVFWGPHQAPRLQALSGRRYKPGGLPALPQPLVEPMVREDCLMCCR